jgi:hypothetical protein
MRTSRSIFYTALGTVLCLLYVFQQTEIVKLGYRIKTAEKVLESCWDRKTALEYTLSSLESPLNMDKSLFIKGDDFEMAKDYKLVKLAPRRSGPGTKGARPVQQPDLKRLAFVPWFAARSAEARTIK